MLPVSSQPFYTPYTSPSNYNVPGYSYGPASVNSPYTQSVYNRSEVIGQETFDPDPITTSYVSQPPPQRVTAVGPYGINGEHGTFTGIYKPPAVRTHVTRDVHEHPVTTSQYPIASTSPLYPSATLPFPPPPSYSPPVSYPVATSYSIPVSYPVTSSPVASSYSTPTYPYLPQTQYAPSPVTQPYQRVVSTRSEVVGSARFDPDSTTTSFVSQSPAQRVTATGPYGAGGQQETVTGVYKPAPVRTFITSDISEHNVNVI